MFLKERTQTKVCNGVQRERNKRVCDNGSIENGRKKEKKLKMSIHLGLEDQHPARTGVSEILG